eukprot:1432316-Karenia_brevis.AAC.1
MNSTKEKIFQGQAAAPSGARVGNSASMVPSFPPTPPPAEVTTPAPAQPSDSLKQVDLVLMASELQHK